MAFVLGIVALAYEILKITTSQNSAIHVLIFKIVLTICLLSYYPAMCKWMIDTTDNFTQTILNISQHEMSELIFDKTVEDANKIEEEAFQETYKQTTGLFGKRGKKDEKAKLSFGKIKEPKKTVFNPFKISLIQFNIYTLLASALLVFCQVAVSLVMQVREVILALLIFIGRFCVIGFIFEKSEGIAKGWFGSFLNALSWSIWLALISALMSSSGLSQFITLAATEPKNTVLLVRAIASLLIYLLLFIGIFNINRELLGGSFGAIGASLAVLIGTQTLSKGIIKTRSKMADLIKRGAHLTQNDTKSGASGESKTTEMDSSLLPVQPDSNASYHL